MLIETRFPPTFARRILLGGLAFLVLMQCIITFGHLGLHRPFGALTILCDLDREGNLPTLFNVLLFFIASLFFFAVGRAHTGRAQWPWNLMALVTFFLGFDEGSQIHESFMVVTLKLLGGGEVKVGEMGWLFFAWTIPYGIAALALLIILVPWFMKLDARTRNGMLLAGFVYIMGAVVVEMCSGVVAEELVVSQAGLPDPPFLVCEAYSADSCYLYADWRFVWLYTLEETLEMLGIIICILTLLRLLERQKSVLQVAFSEKSDQA